MSTTPLRQAGGRSGQRRMRAIGKCAEKPAAVARFQVEGLERRVLLSAAIAAFQPRQLSGAGASASSVALADVNGDGKLDLITDNSSNSTISVLLGAGNGTFQFQRTIATGVGPQSLTIADVNGDGKLDVLLVNHTDSTIGVLLGNGNGTFHAQQTFATVTHDRQFAVADVNGDGKPDIVAATYSVGGVLLGNGDGTFKAQQTFSITGGAYSMGMGDLNGDGKPDLLVGSGFGDVGVMLGNGNGTFQTPQFFPAGNPVVESIAVADLNHDGKADVVTANEGPTVSILLGNGDGTLKAQQTYAATSGFVDYVIVADVNVDGNPDIVFPDVDGDTVVVMLGNGNGTFQAQQSFLAGLISSSIAVGDVNGDGRPDVAAPLGAFNEVTVLLGDVPPVVQSITRSAPPGPNTTGNANFTVTFSEPVTGVDPTDFTVSTTGGLTDTGVSVSGSGAVYTVHVNGVAGLGTLGLNLVDDGTIKDALGNPLQPGGVTAFQPQQTFTAGASPRRMAVADINGDGKPDIVASNYYYYNGGIVPITDGEVSVLLGNGNGTFKTPNVFFTDFAAPTAVAVADVNNDGRPDVVVTSSGGIVDVLLGNGNGTLQAARSFAVGAGPSALAVADVNGDGKPDLIVTNGNANTVSVLLGNGNGAFQAQRTFGVSTLPFSVAVGDFNRDGKPDIAVANYTSNTLSVLIGNGDGTFAAQQTYADPGSPTSLAVSDFNGDGIADLVTCNFTGKSVGVLPGTGTGTFQAAQTFAAGGSPNALAVADLNGDGKPDVVVNNGNGYDSVSVLLGNGNGTFQSRQSFYGGDQSTALAVADLNGDGRPDVAIANYGFFHYSPDSVSVLLGNSNANLTGPVYTVIGPTANVTSINRSSPATQITGASSVSFAVTFSTAVSNVSPSDFQVINSGDVAFTSTLVVSGSGTSYTVTVNGILGNGTLQLALVDHDTIVDGFGTPIGGAGIGNASFTGQSYSILQTLPAVVSINRSSPTGPNTSASSVTFTVTFNTSVVGVDPTDFQSVTTGTASFTNPLVVSGSGASYTVTINGIGGSGTLGLNLVDNGTIRDALGNPLQGNPVSFRPQQMYPTGNSNPPTTPRQAAVGDVNGDGIPDLIVTTSKFSYANVVDVLLGNGNGTFGPSQTFAAGGFPYAVAVADMNGDGNADLVVSSSNASGGIVCVLLGNGNGTFLPQQSFAAGNTDNSLVVADLNGDGKLDVVTANENGQSVSVLLGNGNGTFLPQQTFATGLFPTGVVVTDLNGDGKPDLVLADAGVNSVDVLLGNGDGTFQPRRSLAAGSSPAATAVGDLNGDGRLDLVVANYDAGSVSVMLGNGNGTFQPQQTLAVGRAPNSIFLADMNGDGKLDVLVNNRESSTVSVLLGNGNGTFQLQRSFTTGFLPSALAVWDLNGDGRPDLVTPDFYDTTSVLLANSNGNFTGQTYNIFLNLDTATGTSGVDFITLVQDVDGQHIDWTINATNGQLLINDPNGLTINGNGSNDVIALIYAGGANPLPNTLHLNGTFTVNNLTGANPFAGTNFEIGRSTVFISYAGPTSDPILAIKSYLQAGYNNGAWNGAPTASTGVIMSIPAQSNSKHSTAIGYADSSDGTGTNTTSNTIELKYTLIGDANLSANVNSADLQALLSRFNLSGSWDLGDFNYDGIVNSADLQALLSTFNTSLGNQVTPVTAPPTSGAAPVDQITSKPVLMPSVVSNPPPATIETGTFASAHSRKRSSKRRY